MFPRIQRLSKNTILYVLVLLCTVSIRLQAQERCATVEYQHHLQQIKKLPVQEREFENWLQQKISRRKKAGERIQSTYRIPVVVHVIHNGETIGTGVNISKEQIQSQIDVLNKDFNRLNLDAVNTPAEFSSVAGSMSIEFVLARQTPTGCQTNGIVRLDGKALTGRSSWNYGLDEQLKALSIWPTEDYLNIWICNLTDYLGYAQFPVSNLPGLEEYQDGLASTDGAVFSYKVFGSVDYGNFNLDPQYNKGRTATHELGHFFGLRHIWGDAYNCTGTDYVNDTPTQKEETYNCPSHPLAEDKRCNSAPPMFQNYLDYTDDVCMNLFTIQQVERMISVLENSPRRTSLLNSTGLNDPSLCGNDVALVKVTAPNAVTPNDSPQPVIRIQNLASPLSSVTVRYQSNGSSPQEHTITDLSLNAGEILDVSLPSVQLNASENFISVELINPNGDEDIDPSNNVSEVIVLLNVATSILPAVQGFEDDFQDTWVSNNLSGSFNWQEYPLSASENTLYVNAFDDNSIGEEAWFVTPSVDLSQTQKGYVSFYYTYAPRAGKIDKFEILISTDCGENYQPLKVIDLSGTTTTSAWRPTSSSDWQKVKVNLDEFKGNECVRIAFVFTNGNGNNLYIDDVEIGTPPPFTIYPNPAQDEFNVSFNLTEETSVTFQLMDARGSLLGEATFANALGQVQPFDITKLRSGLYFVRIQTISGVWIEKLLVIR